jgi:hypothetical protein
LNGDILEKKTKKLPDKTIIEEKFGHAKILHFLRSDPDVSEWLNSVFEWIKSGEIFVSFVDIAKELSEFSEKDISGDQISKAYGRWKKTGKY